jgi:hypothetical protein
MIQTNSQFARLSNSKLDVDEMGLHETLSNAQHRSLVVLEGGTSICTALHRSLVVLEGVASMAHTVLHRSLVVLEGDGLEDIYVYD